MGSRSRAPHATALIAGCRLAGPEMAPRFAPRRLRGPVKCCALELDTSLGEIPFALPFLEGSAGRRPALIQPTAGGLFPAARAEARYRGIRRERGSSRRSGAGNPRARPDRKDAATDRRTR